MQQNLKATPEQETGLLLGIIFITALIVMLVSIMTIGFPSGSFGKDLGTIIMGLYISTWGIVFYCCHYYSYKSFFFRLVQWLFDKTPGLHGYRATLLFSFCTLLGGVLILLTGAGIV